MGIGLGFLMIEHMDIVLVYEARFLAPKYHRITVEDEWRAVLDAQFLPPKELP